MPSFNLLVCDLDNTLYDWIGYFVPSFYSMVDRVVSITGCDREMLLDEFRSVHQRYNDSEQPFALLETPTIKSLYRDAPWDVIRQELDPAFHAFNSARKTNLRMHSFVRETLELLLRHNIKIVAHTESKLYGVVDRLYRLDLFEFFSTIYCRERSVSLRPDSEDTATWLNRFPMEKIVELSQHHVKPDPEVLLEICARENTPRENAAYVGDSIARDMLMARRAGVYSIWAAYGAEHSVAMYEALVRISHWTADEVEREKQLRAEAKSIQPDYIAHHSFAEVIPALGLDAFPRS
jgi:phosphoglycolate phosphatase